jgi:hypothetical protein
MIRKTRNKGLQDLNPGPLHRGVNLRRDRRKNFANGVFRRILGLRVFEGNR